MNLVGGSALVIEDLDVTMNVVTFLCPRLWPFKHIDRLVKNLIEREIEFTFEYRKPSVPMWMYPWNYRLIVGSRTITFHVRD